MSTESALAALVAALAIPDAKDNFRNQGRDRAIGDALRLLDPGHVVYRVNRSERKYGDYTMLWTEEWCVYIGDERYDWVKHCSNAGGDDSTPSGYYWGCWGCPSDPQAPLPYKVAEHDGVLRPVDIRRRITLLLETQARLSNELQLVREELDRLTASK